MAFYTKNNTNLLNQIETEQKKIDRGSDGRGWRAFKQNGENVDVYDFKISDTKTILVWINSIYQGESGTAFTSNSVVGSTFCVDPDVAKAYILSHSGSGGSFFVRLYELNISTRILTEIKSDVISSVTEITLYKAEILPDSSKIVFLGDNNTFYKIDLDGTNLSSVVLAGSNSDAKSFCLTNTNKAYFIRNIYLYEVVISTFALTLHSISEFSSELSSSAESRNMFVYDNKIYAIVFDSGTTTSCQIFSFEQANPDTNKAKADINDLYGIDGDDAKKMFLTKDENSSWYGVLYENNTTDRKFCYQINLTSLVLTILRVVDSASDAGDTIEQTCIFSTDSTTYPTIATRGAIGSNSDEGGGNFMQINSIG